MGVDCTTAQVLHCPTEHLIFWLEKNSVFKLRLPSEFKSPKPQAVAAIVPDEQVLMDMENSQISEKFLPGGNSYKKINKVGHRDTTFISKSIIHEPSINTATVESLTLNRSEIEMSIPGSSLNETEVGRSKTETTPGLTRSVKESVPKARAMSLNSRVGTLNALKLSTPSKIQGNDFSNGASGLPVLASADLKKDENLRKNERCPMKTIFPLKKSIHLPYIVFTSISDFVEEKKTDPHFNIKVRRDLDRVELFHID